MSQTQAFIDDEGDAWFERNLRRLGERDPVGEAIDRLGIKPRSVLEVGCANGWRLKKLQAQHGCEIAGIDPSKCAVWAADHPDIKRGWADRIPFLSDAFDLVIYGFCLYVTEPVDWFTIVAEGDRVLKNGGHLIVHDFGGFAPHARKYEHADNILAYHVPFAHFWLAHPWYRFIEWSNPVEGEQVAVMQKDTSAIPERP